MDTLTIRTHWKHEHNATMDTLTIWTHWKHEHSATMDTLTLWTHWKHEQSWLFTNTRHYLCVYHRITGVLSVIVEPIKPLAIYGINCSTVDHIVAWIIKYVRKIYKTYHVYTCRQYCFYVFYWAVLPCIMIIYTVISSIFRLYMNTPRIEPHRFDK